MSISVQELTKYYGQQQALNAISFEVNEGEVLGFLGPNGAGKSTTLKIMTGFLAPDSGSVYIHGHNVNRAEVEARKLFGYLPEHNPLYPEMGVIDFLTFAAGLYGMKRTTINHRLAQVIGACGLAPEVHKPIGELSKGFRQRVGLAQALIHDPEVLILDEPTSGLDPNQMVDIRSLIRDAGREKTVILSSHILKEVEATCDRVVIINEGNIVADESPDNLTRKASGTQRYLVAIGGDAAPEQVEAELTAHFRPVIASPQREAAWEIETGDEEAFQKELWELCRTHNWHIRELRPVENSLEDVFRKLTSSTTAA